MAVPMVGQADRLARGLALHRHQRLRLAQLQRQGLRRQARPAKASKHQQKQTF